MWDLAEKILTVSAAWVQAVGSIVALYVAFKVASRQAERDNRKRDQEQADWRAGMIALASEMQRYLEAASRMYDEDENANFLKDYDPAYPNRLTGLLYERIGSDKMLAGDIAPALRIIKYFKNGTDPITQKFPNIDNLGLALDLPIIANDHAELIKAEIAEMGGAVPV